MEPLAYFCRNQEKLAYKLAIVTGASGYLRDFVEIARSPFISMHLEF